MATSNFFANLENWKDDKFIHVIGTSSDENHLPKDCLDSSTDTFFMTTGLFPQELIFIFREEISLQAIKTTTRNVLTISFDSISFKDEPNENEEITNPTIYTPIVTKSLADKKGKIQVCPYKIDNVTTKYIRLKIETAYDLFAAIHSVRFQTSDDKWLKDD